MRLNYSFGQGNRLLHVLIKLMYHQNISPSSGQLDHLRDFLEQTELDNAPQDLHWKDVT